MRTRLMLTSLMMIAAGCASHREHAESEAGEADEVKVAFDQVPANVKMVLMRESKGATIASVDKETLNGRPVYEADVMVDGKNHEIVVGADGMLVHNKLDEAADEEKMSGKAEADEKDEKDEKDEMKEKK